MKWFLTVRCILIAGGVGALVSGCSSRSTARSDAGSPNTSCIADGDPFAIGALRERVSFLASPALAGRGPGSAGDQAARAAIEARFRCLGLQPGGDSASYQQPFRDSDGKATANVIGVVPGSDPEVGSDIVVVGAHHDHLGDSGGGAYPGANDNASGITALLAIAQAIKQSPTAPRRTIAFVAFGSEEPPALLEGSAFYVGNPPTGLPMDRVVYMINLDMVGSYSVEQTVYALGSFSGTPGRTLLDQLVASHPAIEVSLGEPGEDSDHISFCTLGIPYIFFWTEGDGCYHERCDTADRVDYPNMAEIARLAADLTRGLADTTVDLADTRANLDIGCSGE